MILSILIPTLTERKYHLDQMLKELTLQINRLNAWDKIEVITEEDQRQITTGAKRNKLIQRAQGEYTVFVDDDDHIDPSYISELLKAIESKPDVVTFQGWVTTNGASRVEWTIKLGEAYEERNGHYYRWPNHLCAYKRELIKDLEFQNISQREDFFWSILVKDSGRIKTEVHIPKKLYHYDYLTVK